MNEPYDPPPPSAPPPSPPPPGGPPSYGGPGAPSGLAWEQAKGPGSLVETTKRFITAPTDAYAAAKEKGDLVSPLIFGVVMVTLGAIISAFYQLLLPGPGSFLEDMEGIPPEMAEALSASGGVTELVATVVLMPIIAIVVLFIWSGIVHLTLSLLGGLRDSTAGFEGTFRSASYSTVSNLAQLVPVVGGLIAFVWSVALQMIGLSTIHRTSQGKALAAVLLPFLLCCCLGIGLAMAFGAAIGAAAGLGGS